MGGGGLGEGGGGRGGVNGGGGGDGGGGGGEIVYVNDHPVLSYVLSETKCMIRVPVVEECTFESCTVWKRCDALYFKRTSIEACHDSKLIE